MEPTANPPLTPRGPAGGTARRSAQAGSPAADPRIIAAAVALPDHVFTQEEVAGHLRAWLAHDPEKAAKATAILGNAQVSRRHAVRPAEWYLANTSVDARTAAYREEMVRLCQAAATDALERAGVEAGEIGLIVSTSCTGVMIPPVESHLMNRMPFRAETRRMPLTELGCVAGATALTHASHYLRAHPAGAALVLSGELASLTAQVGDFSLTNIVAASIFGDGAAAAVLVGPEHPRASGAGANGSAPLPSIRDSRSVQFPDSLELMGFHNTDSGLRIFLSPRVPRFIRDELPRHLAPFLADHGLEVADLRHFLLHPGGRKVLEGLEGRLGLGRDQTALSWDVLRECGNLSSATVLFLLERFFRTARPEPGDHGLLMAVGPGFAAELVLLRW